MKPEGSGQFIGCRVAPEIALVVELRSETTEALSNNNMQGIWQQFRFLSLVKVLT